tara:strand:- start:80 stop:319 length:240 start_codon:yes stop_codon:yes gene_type:complete
MRVRFPSVVSSTNKTVVWKMGPHSLFLKYEVFMSFKIKKDKIRNPYATALQKRHGGGVKAHKDKSKYTRKVKHKGRELK